MKQLPELPQCKRLEFRRFNVSDAGALAEILADPEVTRNITSNGSSPERCLASAQSRIKWHNQSWDDAGYGVWALFARPDQGLADGLAGWCGFTSADVEGEDPEILYALSANFRGQGLATEAARAAIKWYFDKTSYSTLSAIIFTRLNPGSVKVVKKLGMVYSGQMSFEDFLSETGLALEVLEYEVWRLREAAADDLAMLCFQAAFRAGQLVKVSQSGVSEIEAKLLAAISGRLAKARLVDDEYRSKVLSAFHQGLKETYMDRYVLTRESREG